MTLNSSSFLMTLLGRTTAVKVESLIRLLEILSSLKRFSSTNTGLNGWPQLEWLVDSPVSIESYNIGAGASARLVAPPTGFEFEVMDPFSVIHPWADCISLAGLILHPGAQVAINVVGGGQPDCIISVTLLPLEDMSPAGAVNDSVQYIEMFKFILDHVGAPAAIDFKYFDGKTVFKKTEFNIVSRKFPDFTIAKFGLSNADSGITDFHSLEIDIADLEARRRVLNKLHTMWPYGGIRWDKVSISAPDAAAWVECLSWCRKQGHTPWVQTQIAASKDVWSVEAFLEKGMDYEVINLGSLKFPKKDASNTVPKDLRGLEVKVDAFREGEGWHLAFHTFEDGLDVVPRRKAATALDAILGGNVITRTPETMWPHLFPMPAPKGEPRTRKACQ